MTVSWPWCPWSKGTLFSPLLCMLFIVHCRSCPTLWDPVPGQLPYPPLSPEVCPNSCPLMMRSNHLILCHPLLLLPSVFDSIRVFCNELALHIRWPECWSFSLSTDPSSEFSGLTSFRIDWFDLSAVQETLKSLFQYHILKVSILRCSAVFMVQLSHLSMTTGKTVALTRWTFVSKVMSLLLNTLSRFVIAFLPRSKRLLISWLHVGISSKMLGEMLGLRWYWVSLQLGLLAQRPPSGSGAAICASLCTAAALTTRTARKMAKSQPVGWALGVVTTNDEDPSARWQRRLLFSYLPLC